MGLRRSTFRAGHARAYRPRQRRQLCVHEITRDPFYIEEGDWHVLRLSEHFARFLVVPQRHESDVPQMADFRFILHSYLN